MKIRIKKKGDGSATSGRLGPGGFGAIHDLAHYVVESGLSLRHGFFGLLEQGWAVSDFTAKGAAARLPDESIVTECVVGLLTNAVLAGSRPDPADFAAMVHAAVAGVRPGAPTPSLAPAMIAAWWRRLDGLVRQWRRLPSGGALELEFPAGVPAANHASCGTV